MDEIFTLYQDLHDFLGPNEICSEFCASIHSILKEAVDTIPSGSRVGIRCADPCAEYLIRTIDFSHTNVIGVFDLQREGSFCGYPLFLAEELPNMACDYIIFAIYTYRTAILQELQSFKGKIIDVYSLLNEHGIVLRGPIRLYRPGYPLVLNYFYLKYMECRHKNFEEQALRDFLQAAVEYKDFVMIFRICKEYGENKYPMLSQVWRKASHLLKSIKNQIKNRKHEDIIAFWTDSISYFELDLMPEFKDKMETGCFFEQTYTNCPWTRPTMQIIFQKRFPIDNFSYMRDPIKRTNSSLISCLEDKGYEVRWVSFQTWAMDSAYTVPEINEGMSSSVIWWLGLQSLLRTDRPCFYMFHFFVEGHEPMISPDITEFDFSSPDFHLRNAKIESRRKATLAYLDQCLTLYNQLLGSKTQIFFSDHGPSYPNVPNWSEERLRTYCLVLGRGIPKMRVSSFFSYVDFENLVQWILEPQKSDFNTLLSRETIFQGEDYYAERIVNSTISSIKQGNPHNGIAFCGVRTGNCKYVLNALGEEYYYIINEDGTETWAPLEDDALRAELQSKCGTYFIDIRKYDKFKHSRKLYESILRDHPELGPPLWLAGEDEA